MIIIQIFTKVVINRIGLTYEFLFFIFSGVAFPASLRILFVFIIVVEQIFIQLFSFCGLRGSTTLVEATDEVITNEGTQQVNADKLHILKQSLNKIEQGTLLSGSMSTDDKSSFVKLINQARAKLRSVEKLHSYRRYRASTTTSPEWVKARQKLKAIAKFKGASKK